MNQNELFRRAEENPQEVLCLLTFLGEQTKPVPSVLFVAADLDRDLPGLPGAASLYPNDRLVEPERVRCTEPQVTGLARVARSHALRSLEEPAFFRFATASGDHWDEGLVPRQGAGAFLYGLLEVFGEDHLEARRALTRMRRRVL